MLHVLVVDDELVVRKALHALMSGLGMQVTLAEDGVDARGKLGSGGPFDLVLTDLKMPRADGFEVLRAAAELAPGVPIIMLTAHGSLGDCVAAMRAGAANFLAKPFHPAELEEVVKQTIANAAKPPKGKRTPPPIPGKPQVMLAGTSPRLSEVLELIERVARTDATVLISGETGTGKEVAARLLHTLSDRAGAPFVAVNCGAIPEGLIESELFGHAKGAYTGATDKRVGRFAAADGGTLFLDEIGDLPLALQVRLLRVLQDHEVTPVGESAAQPIDVRVITATHRNLEDMVAAGAFRQDLFYRLNVVQVEMPALRERREDIVALAERFLESAAHRVGRKLSLSAPVRAALERHDWPGNVRELENLMERLAIIARAEEISLGDLPPKLAGGNNTAPVPALRDEGVDMPKTLATIERQMIEEALRKTGGNKNKAAALLGINRTTLVEKLKRGS